MARGHVDVSERRLRPIYDALDNGNNKKALQESEKALKKQKDLLCAKALRGLALLRLGRVEECAVQMKEVHDEAPTDDATLQAMSISYREMHRLDMIAELYENGHHKQPRNEEILSALFMAYVRVHNYKKQQQTAIKLHKLRPEKNPYYFWNVMSIVMQAHEADAKLANTMFLPLAERMTEKYANEDRIEAEAEVNLYVLVLEQLQKHQKALDVLQGPLAEKLHSEPDYVEVKTAELLAKLGQWPKVNQLHRRLLQKMPDHWQFYLQYLSSVFQLVDTNYVPPPNPNLEKTQNDIESQLKNDGDMDSSDQSKTDTENKEKEKSDDAEEEQKAKTENDDVKENGDTSKEEGAGVIDYTVQMTLTFINTQIETLEASDSRPMRGPYLAKLELLKQLRARERSETEGLALESARDLIIQYYKMFGDKSCCFSDLKPYMELLSCEEQKTLLEEWSQELCLTLDGDIVFPTDRKVMSRHLTVQKLSRFAGAHEKTSMDEKMALIKEYYLRHQDGLQFGHELIETDMQFSDDYLLLACHLLHDAYVQEGDQQYLWQACVLLEKGLITSKSNFQIKLLLIKLYCLLGAFGPCPSLYDSMEIKHIQNDSLGYTVTNHIARLGHISSAASLYETMLRFFTMNQKETTEYLVQSYKYGSFAKIIEFVKFRERLKNSFQYAAAKTERMLLDLTMETISHESSEQMVAYMDIRPEERNIVPLEGMTDNRDGKVMAAWHPEQHVYTPERAQQSMKEEVAWIKLRNITLSLLGASVICAQTLALDLERGHKNDLQNGDDAHNKVTSSRELLEDLMKQFSEALEEAKAHATPVNYPLCGPYRTRISTYVALGLGELLLQLNSLLLHVHKVLDNRADVVESSVKELSQNIMDTFSGLVSANSKDVITESDDSNNKFFNTDLLENLVLINEVVGHACIVLGAVYRVVRPLKPPAARKGKKKQRESINIGAAESLFSLCGALKRSLQEQVDAVTEVFRRMDSTVLNMSLQALTISPVPGQSPHSQDETLSKVNDAVKSKVLESYQISAREMLTFLHNKNQYISTLVL